jgi:alginate O-acetyltransferase complex protein AlgI
MLFNSGTYGVFFLLVFLLYWILRKRETPRLFLLLASSYFFYGCWSWRFLGLILFSTTLDYVVGRLFERLPDRERHRRGRRWALVASLVGNLGVLGFFKYWNFFAEEAVALFGAFGFETGPVFTDIILPVGISFYTFQTLSYTIDIYRGELVPERSLLRFAIFVAFFPQLVAGPIVRAKHFLPQLRVAPKLSQRTFEWGLTLIFWGLVKKVMIADVLGRGLVDPFWADPAAYDGWESLLAIYGYAFQIFGDFSGYSDIAIGSAALLGFDLGLNFRSPYRSTSAKELWTRWHISLSSWLRDYLYFPLGGNRRGPWLTYRNLILTMLLGGLWHGAAWLFVAWGAYHGLLLAIERWIGIPEPKTTLAKTVRCILFFHLICLGWVLFRSPDVASGLAVCRSLFSTGGAGTISLGVGLALIVGIVTHFPPRTWKERLRERFMGLPSVVQGVVYAAVLGMILYTQSGETPFIYFQF